jgi:hypothetical protein
MTHFLLLAIVAAHARGNVADALLPEARPRLTVNAGEPADQAAFVAALRSMSSSFGHHSHPVGNIYLQIQTSSGSVELNLRRDSERPDEYWVFMPAYWSTADAEIGRITSPIFANY